MTKEEIVSKEINNAKLNFKTYNRPRYWAALFQILISMVLVVGFQWVVLRVEVDAWEDPKFWANTIFSTAALYLIYTNVIVMRLPKTEKREKVCKARQQYNELASKRQLDFKDYIDFFNVGTKTQTYVSKINAKIIKLEEKLKATRREKKRANLAEKIEFNKSLIAPEYLKANIDNIKCSYYKVHYYDFMEDSTDSQTKDLITRANYNTAVNLASLKKMLIYVLSTIFMAISVFKFDGFDISQFFINLSGSAFLIISRIGSALMDADKIYDRTVLASMECKTQILKSYQEWHADKLKMGDLSLEDKTIENTLRQELKSEYEAKLRAQVADIKNKLVEAAKDK